MRKSMMRYEWKKLSHSSAFWGVCLTLLVLHILLCLFIPATTNDSISAEEYRQGLIRIIENAKWNLEDYRLYGDGYLVRYQEKIIEIYQRLLDIEFVPMTFKGWDVYFTNSESDILWMLGAVFCGIHLVMLERNSGMYVLNHLLLRRKKMFPSKMWMLFLLSVCTMALFMTILLVFIAIRFGFSPLDTPLCSIRDFQYCPYPLTVGNYLLISFLMKTIQFFILTLIGANLAKLFSEYLLSLFSGLCILGVGYVYELENFSFLFERYQAVDLFGVPVSAVGCMCCIFIGILSILVICFLTYFSKYILENFRRKRKNGIYAVCKMKNHRLFWYEAKKIFGSAKIIIIIGAILICKVSYSFWRIPKADTTEEIYKELCFSLAGEATEEKYTYIQSELANTRAILEQKENMLFAVQSGEIDHKTFDEYLQTYYSAEHRNAALLRLETQYFCAISAGGDILYDSGWRLFFSIPPDIFQGVLLIVLCLGYFGQERKSGVYRLLQTTSNGEKKLFQTELSISVLYTIVIFLVFFGIDFLLTVIEFPMNHGNFSFANLGILNIPFTLNQAAVLFVMIRLVGSILLAMGLIWSSQNLYKKL